MIRLDEGGRRRDAHLMAPPRNLSGVIEHLWVHGVLPRNVWRVVPDANAYVIFQIADGTASCSIVGARSRYCDIDVSGRELTIGVRLRQGVLSLFIRDSASRLTDAAESLEAVIGSDGRLLNERLANARPEDRLLLLTRFLEKRLNNHDPMWPAEARSVGDLGRQWNISRRAVYDRTRESIGLAPRLFLRVQRLHRALAILPEGTSLADIAILAGYSDQSHWTREATELLGETPGEWRRRGCSNVQDSDRDHGRH